jgi:hypothetical protein
VERIVRGSPRQRLASPNQKNERHARVGVSFVFLLFLPSSPTTVVQGMDINAFWREQMTKNKSGAPRYEVTVDPGMEENGLMTAWIEKWRDHFTYFNNVGCGCCINIYEFDAPEEAVAEIPEELVSLYEELHRPIQSGTLPFSKSSADWANV